MSTENLFDSLNQRQREALRKTPQPDWLEPMLATLTHDYFDDPDWIYERKLDGERCLVFKNAGKVVLRSRNRKALNPKYPELVDALENQAQDGFIADGEIVAFDGARTSFARLQPRMQASSMEEAKNSKVPVYLYLFDLLYADRHDVSKLTLRTRKALLKRLLEYRDPLRYCAHRNEHGTDYYQEACNKGWEGVIAKDAVAAYCHGRSSKWLKFKCVHQQEFVIGGYTEPRGSRAGFGALLLGYYADGKLIAAGKVGTGFDDKLLKRMHERMRELEQSESPFEHDQGRGSNVHWLEPALVGEVGFTEWTEDGKLRHPRFLGLRDDKDPSDVVREDTA